MSTMRPVMEWHLMSPSSVNSTGRRSREWGKRLCRVGVAGNGVSGHVEWGLQGMG